MPSSLSIIRKKADRRQVKKSKLGTNNNHTTGTGQEEHVKREEELEKLIEPLINVPIDLSTTAEDKLLEAFFLYIQ